jgi:S-formylglutathione hydrolase FrmB
VNSVLSWSTVTGAVPAAVTVAGAISLLWLLAGRGRRWWLRLAPAALAAGVTLTAVLVIVVDQVWRPFPDSLPLIVQVWIGVALTALGLSALRSWSTRWSQRVLAGIAALLVLACAAVQVNRFYGQYPTVRAALGLAPPGAARFGPDAAGTPRPGGGPATTVAAPPGQRLAEVWRAPPAMPPRGVVSEVDIPAHVSQFAARRGWVYLPPAYLAHPRARLPVLVLVSGQPGSPRDWLDGGRLDAVLDGFAAAHAGLAPVVVIPDHLGAVLANPLCLDSRLGNVETYLSVDVPAWIKATLDVDQDPRHWAIGGYSQGGTCALQLAVRAPHVYSTFIDISGQDEPTLGDRRSTVRAAFDGDEKAFRRVNPLDILANHRFPTTSAMIVVGRQDDRYRPQQHRVQGACHAAGMDVTWMELPGGHTWGVWGPGLEQSLPWLAVRAGLTAERRR